MATAYQNLSSCDNNTVPHSPLLRVAIVCAEWNADITDKLLEGACNTLEKHGVKPENIFVEYVPGTYELTFGAQRMAAHYRPDAVIVLGSVIQGDTPHFDYLSRSYRRDNASQRNTRNAGHFRSSYYQ